MPVYTQSLLALQYHADVASEFMQVVELKDIDLVQCVLKDRETQRRQAERRNNLDDDFQDGNPEIV